MPGTSVWSLVSISPFFETLSTPTTSFLYEARTAAIESVNSQGLMRRGTQLSLTDVQRSEDRCRSRCFCRPERDQILRSTTASTEASNDLRHCIHHKREESSLEYEILFYYAFQVLKWPRFRQLGAQLHSSNPGTSDTRQLRRRGGIY